MAKSGLLEFGNLVVTADDQELLDMAESIVLPAFFDDEVRSVRSSQYFFHRVRLVQLLTSPEEDEGLVWGIVGRLVKSTTIKSTQGFDHERDELVQKQIQLNVAPSSIFVVILNDHRVLYLPETSGAPFLSTFGATIKHFIHRKHEALVNRERDRLTADPSQIPQGLTVSAALKQTFPKPQVDLIPLTREQGIGNFLDQFTQLNSVHFKIVTPNGENLNFAPFLQELIDEKATVGASNTTLNYSNPTDGLNPEPMRERIETALTSENVVVTFDGVNEQGAELTGRNEDFQLRVPFAEETQGAENITSIARHMFDRFRQQRREGNLPPAPPPADPDRVRDRLREIARRAGRTSL